jgi:TonB family protein
MRGLDGALVAAREMLSSPAYRSGELNKMKRILRLTVLAACVCAGTANADPVSPQAAPRAATPSFVDLTQVIGIPPGLIYPHHLNRPPSDDLSQAALSGCPTSPPIVEFTIRPDGTTTDIVMRASSGNQKFDAAAVEDVASMKYSAPVYNGYSISIRTRLWIGVRNTDGCETPPPDPDYATRHY